MTTEFICKVLEGQDVKDLKEKEYKTTVSTDEAPEFLFHLTAIDKFNKILKNKKCFVFILEIIDENGNTYFDNNKNAKWFIDKIIKMQV